MRMSVIAMLAATVTLFAGSAGAQVTVTEPWVRGVVESQKATGLFMKLASKDGGTLVAAASPLAGIVEIHEMKMDGNVMKMRAIAGLDLPAGKVVELKPGSYHVMLMDLKRPLKNGETVPVTLTIEGKDKLRQTVQVDAIVRDLAATSGASGAAHKH
jgi:copper(I)-binding protein